MSHHLVEVDSLSYSYPDGTKALEDVSFRVVHGESVAVVGANGAGKSTLIGALLGVLKASSGTIRVLGRELPAGAMEVRARSGVMAEQAGIFPGGSGVDAVMFAEGSFIFWETSYTRDSHHMNIWLGPQERQYIRALQDFSYRLDTGIKRVRVTQSGSQADQVNAYALASDQCAAVYFHHHVCAECPKNASKEDKSKIKGIFSSVINTGSRQLINSNNR